MAYGAGDDRTSGQLELRLLSPPFASRTRFVVDIEGNVLTADTRDELYYLYHVGFERERGAGLVGAYFYHRSNHQLQPNDLVTSINVLETGIETHGWRRPGRRQISDGWDHLDGRIRVGYVLDSEFGLDRRVNAFGGLRWTIVGRGPMPFLSGLVEVGDVDRHALSLGISPSANLDLQLQYLDDEQLFSVDSSAVLLLARYGF